MDHPATQSWKRRRLKAAGIEEPPWLRFAPCDFESDNLPDVLVDTGWDETQPSFFIWLGVVPYLTSAAVGRTLALLGGFGGGSEVVFDYGEPAHLLSDEARAAQARRAEAVASVGEPFLSYFEPPAIAAMVRDAGFGTIEDLGPHRLMERYLRTHAPDLLADDAPWRRRPDHGGHVLVARTCA